jgi:hypothetical protein
MQFLVISVLITLLAGTMFLITATLSAHRVQIMQALSGAGVSRTGVSHLDHAAVLRVTPHRRNARQNGNVISMTSHLVSRGAPDGASQTSGLSLAA